MLYAVDKPGFQFCLQKICGYISKKTLLHWMVMNRHFYLRIVAALLRPLCIFTRRGLQLKENSASILILSQNNLEWVPFYVREEGEDDMEARFEYFENEDQEDASWSKIV